MTFKYLPLVFVAFIILGCTQSVTKTFRDKVCEHNDNRTQAMECCNEYESKARQNITQGIDQERINAYRSLDIFEAMKYEGVETLLICSIVDCESKDCICECELTVIK